MFRIRKVSYPIVTDCTKMTCLSFKCRQRTTKLWITYLLWRTGSYTSVVHLVTRMHDRNERSCQSRDRVASDPPSLTVSIGSKLQNIRLYARKEHVITNVPIAITYAKVSSCISCIMQCYWDNRTWWYQVKRPHPCLLVCEFIIIIYVSVTILKKMSSPRELSAFIRLHIIVYRLTQYT